MISSSRRRWRRNQRISAPPLQERSAKRAPNDRSCCGSQESVGLLGMVGGGTTKGRVGKDAYLLLTCAEAWRAMRSHNLAANLWPLQRGKALGLRAGFPVGNDVRVAAELERGPQLELLAGGADAVGDVDA